MQVSIHRADSRGRSYMGWLKSHHTYSFAHYYDAARMGFGKLRVLNDDWVQGGSGFDTHQHRNMEIVSFPLEGSMAHADSSGHSKVIEAGEVQIMSAGSGIAHSEYNYSETDPLVFLQIWIKPERMNTSPTYDQKYFSDTVLQDRFQLVVAPEGGEDSLKINQDCQFSRANLSAGTTIDYPLYGGAEGRGVYVFLLEGKVQMGENSLSRRDGAEVTNTDCIAFTALEVSQQLLIEVPL